MLAHGDGLLKEACKAAQWMLMRMQYPHTVQISRGFFFRFILAWSRKVTTTLHMEHIQCIPRVHLLV